MKVKAKLTFCGGTGVVTGSNFLLEVGSKKILIDCGLEQGTEFASEENHRPFPYDPHKIDLLFVTHAHTDHIGRIPKLVRDGFRGKIYSTPATRDLASVMLPDTLRILDEEGRRFGVMPLYDGKDIDQTFKLWEVIPYYTSQPLAENVSVYFKDSGHILGSVLIEFTINGKKIVFTGDLGNSPTLFLRDTDQITDADYLVMESVYGDRNHESKEERKSKFVEVIKDTVHRKRTLLIPAFSLERTQDMLFEINELVEQGAVKDLNVFIDSPLASHVTEIYKRYTQDFKKSAQAQIKHGDDPFDFPKLKFTIQRQQSEKIDHTARPKIIIAGSGMSAGGRIIKHEKTYLPDPHTTLLFVGYQTVGSIGRRIMDGAKEIHIGGERVPVRAEVKKILGYSSHMDSDHLIEFVSHTASTAKKVFVAIGEPKSVLFLVQRLRDYLDVNAVAPKKGETVELEF